MWSSPFCDLPFWWQAHHFNKHFTTLIKEEFIRETGKDIFVATNKMIKIIQAYCFSCQICWRKRLLTEYEHTNIQHILCKKHYGHVQIPRLHPTPFLKLRICWKCTEGGQVCKGLKLSGGELRQYCPHLLICHICLCSGEQKRAQSLGSLYCC